MPYSHRPVIFVVDDDVDMCRTLRRMLAPAGYDVSVYNSADDFLACGELHRSGCVVLDIQMPGISGPELHRRLVEEGAEMAVVFASGHADVPISVEAMKLGAVDVLQKPFTKDELLAAIGNAVSKLHTMQQEREERETLEYLHNALTDREKEVFALVVNGQTNRQVGEEIGASEKTIKLHRRRIMQKMGVTTLADLVRVAERLGM
jgi:FixJ family two-component response regulator